MVRMLELSDGMVDEKGCLALVMPWMVLLFELWMDFLFVRVCKIARVQHQALETFCSAPWGAMSLRCNLLLSSGNRREGDEMSVSALLVWLQRLHWHPDVSVNRFPLEISGPIHTTYHSSSPLTTDGEYVGVREQSPPSDLRLLKHVKGTGRYMIPTCRSRSRTQDGQKRLERRRQISYTTHLSTASGGGRGGLAEVADEGVGREGPVVGSPGRGGYVEAAAKRSLP